MNILYIIKIILILLIIIVLIYAFCKYIYCNEFKKPVTLPKPVTKEKFTPSGKIVLYHASWCGHCKNFMPIYDKFIEYAKKNIKNIEVTKCNGDNAECKKDFIKGFPTVVFHKKNGNVIIFDDDRTMDALIKFANKHL